MMDSLKEKLRKHRSTRDWVAREPTPTPAGLDDSERSLRRGLELQSRLADALLGYAEAVAGAFEALLRAHSALEEEGVFQVDEAAAIAKALLQGFRDAHAVAHRMAEGVRVPLEAHRATLVSCSDDIAKADVAEAEVAHYQEKVNSLEDAAKRQMSVSSRAEGRLSRNRDKLQNAKHSASVAQGCAQDAMSNCLSRQANLCHFALKAVASTAEAIRSAAARLDPSSLAGLAPVEPRKSANTGLDSFQAAMGMRLASAASSENPFSQGSEGFNQPPPRVLPSRPASSGPSSPGHHAAALKQVMESDGSNPFASDL